MQADGLKKEDTGLLEHNREPYEELCRAAEKGAVLYAACPGSGKSYVVIQYLKDHAGRALVVCPKRAIADSWRDLAERYGTALDTMTYQLLYRKSEEQMKTLMSGYGHFVFDECHHVGAGRWGVNCRYIRDNAGEKSVIGLSATPVRYTDGCADVGEEFFGGNVVDGLSQTEAVEAGVLPGFDYVCGVFAFPEELKKTEAAPGTKLYEKLRHLEFCTENRKSVHDAFDRYLPGRDRKGIVFVDAIENLPEAEGVIKGYFGKNALTRVIHSRKSRAKNKAALEEFGAAESGWLFAVDMLNEGLHIPGVDTVVMFRRTASPAVYIQQLGRSQAAGAGRAVVFDFVGNRKSLEVSASVRTGEEGGTKAERKPDGRVIVDFYMTEAASLLSEIYEELDAQSARRPFTPEEDEFLRKHYKERGGKWCSEQPEMGGRSLSAIHVRAMKLGLGERRPRYSEDEIKVLRERYAELGAAGCAELLPGRDASSIHVKAHELGLTCVGYFTPEEDAFLKAHYAERGGKWCSEQPEMGGRSLSAIHARAMKLGFAKKHYSEAEIRILRERYADLGPAGCAELLPGRSVDSVKAKARGMGLTSTLRFTPEEDEFLKRHYAERGGKWCSEQPEMNGRSRGSVYNRAYVLGIAKEQEVRSAERKCWEPEEDAVIAEVFGRDGIRRSDAAAECAERLPGRTHKACWMRAAKLKADGEP